MTEVYRDSEGELYLYNSEEDRCYDKYGEWFYGSERKELEKVHLQPPEYGKTVNDTRTKREVER